MATIDTANDEEYAFDEFDEDSNILSPGKKTVDGPAALLVEDEEDLDALMTNTAAANDEYGDEEFADDLDTSVGGGTAEAVRVSLTNGVIPAEISSKYERFFSFDAEEESMDNKDTLNLPRDSSETDDKALIHDSSHHSVDDSHVKFIDNNFDNYGNNEDDEETIPALAVNEEKQDVQTNPGNDEYEEEFYEMELAPAFDRQISLKKAVPPVEESSEDTRSGEPGGGEIDLSYISNLLANNAKILENAAGHSQGNEIPSSSSSASPSPRGPTSSGGGPGYFNVLDVLSSEKIPTNNLNNTNTKKFVKVEEVAAKDIKSLSFNVDSTGNTISIVSPSPVQSESAAIAAAAAAVVAASGAANGGGGGSVDVKRLSILKNKAAKVRGASMSSETSNGDRSSRERDREVTPSSQQPQVAAGSKRHGDSASDAPVEEAPAAPSSTVMVSPLSSRKKSSASDSAALAAANKKKAAIAAAKAAAQEEYDELMALVENPAAAAAAGGVAGDDASVNSQNSKAGKGRGTIRSTVVRGTIARVNSNASAGSSNSAASNAAALAALSDIQQRNAMLPMQLPNKGISNAPSGNRASIRKTVVAPARHVKKANVGVTPLISIIQKKPVPAPAAPAAKKPRRAGVSMPDDQVYEEDFNELEEGDLAAPAEKTKGNDVVVVKSEESTKSPKKARSSVRFGGETVVDTNSGPSQQKTTGAGADGIMAPLNMPSILNTSHLMVEGLVTPPREVDNVETSRSVPNKPSHSTAVGVAAAAPSAPKVRGASIRLYNPVPPSGANANRTSHRVAGSIRKVIPTKQPSEDGLALDSKVSSAAGGIVSSTGGSTSAVESIASQSEVNPAVKKDPYTKVQGTMHTQPVKGRPSVAHPVGHPEDSAVVDHVSHRQGPESEMHKKPHPAVDPYSKVQGTMHTQPAKAPRASFAHHPPHHASGIEQKPLDPYANVQGTMHTQPVKTRASVIQQQLPHQSNHGVHGVENHQNSAVDMEEVVEEEEGVVEDAVDNKRQKENDALDSLVSDDRHHAHEDYDKEEFVEESLDSFEEASPSTNTIHNHAHDTHHHHHHQESSAGISTLSGNSTQSHYVTRLHQHVSVAGRMKNHIYPRANKDPFQMYDESSGLFSTFEVEYQRASRLEQYKIAQAEKERQKQIEIESARYSYMKRNQELLVEKHFKEMKLIRDNAQREERIEALRAQHIVAYEKIHNELEEIRLRMENLTNVQGSYKNNYIRMAGNIIPPAPKTKTYQPAEPHKRIKYKNPVAMGPGTGGAGTQAPRHFEQVTVQRQQQQPQDKVAMKPTAPTHSKPTQGGYNKKGKFIKPMPAANAPRKAVHQPSPPSTLPTSAVPVNEFGDLTADASDLHSNPSHIVISEFYDQEDFNSEEPGEVEEAMNGVLLGASHNNAGAGGNESYHSLHNTNYSSLPVELVSVHSPINNVVKVTKTTLVIDVDRMAEEGAGADTPIGSSAIDGEGFADKDDTKGKISRDSSAGYHLYYEPEEEEEDPQEILSPVKENGLDGGASVIEDSISDSNAHQFMSDMVSAGGKATFRSSADYYDESFEEVDGEELQHPENHSSVGFYTMEFDGDEEVHISSGGGGGSGQKPKRKGTPMRRARPVDLEEDSDNDELERGGYEVKNGGVREKDVQRNHRRDGEEYEAEDSYKDTFENEGDLERPGNGDEMTADGFEGAGSTGLGFMAGSVNSLDYSTDFNNTTSGFPFSSSSVLEGSSQVELFSQLDEQKSSNNDKATSVDAARAPKYEGIASGRLNSMYMSQNEDFNAEDEPSDVIVPVSAEKTKPHGEAEDEEDHYHDDFESSGVLPASAPASPKPTHSPQRTVEAKVNFVDEEDEYVDDFNSTQAMTAAVIIEPSTINTVAAAVTTSGGYDEEDEELLMMLSSAPPSQKVAQSVPMEKLEDDEDPYADEEFH